ncbi:MAG: hypothetical protein QXN53_06525 [Thermoproteota archaeon]
MEFVTRELSIIKPCLKNILIKGSALSLLNLNNNTKGKVIALIDELKRLKYRLYALMEKEEMRIKIKNVYCPICHRQTYFTGEVVYEGKRTKVIEWKCADCGVIIKSRHDKFGEVLTKERKWRI